MATGTPTAAAAPARYGDYPPRTGGDVTTQRYRYVYLVTAFQDLILSFLVAARRVPRQDLVARTIALGPMLLTPMLLHTLQMVLLTALQLLTLAMAIPPLPQVLRLAVVGVREIGTILRAMVPSPPAMQGALEMLSGSVLILGLKLTSLKPSGLLQLLNFLIQPALVY